MEYDPLPPIDPYLVSYPAGHNPSDDTGHGDPGCKQIVIILLLFAFGAGLIVATWMFTTAVCLG